MLKQNQQSKTRECRRFQKYEVDGEITCHKKWDIRKCKKTELLKLQFADLEADTQGYRTIYMN